MIFQFFSPPSILWILGWLPKSHLDPGLEGLEDSPQFLLAFPSFEHHFFWLLLKIMIPIKIESQKWILLMVLRDGKCQKQGSRIFQDERRVGMIHENPPRKGLGT